MSIPAGLPTGVPTEVAEVVSVVDIIRDSERGMARKVVEADDQNVQDLMPLLYTIM
jgi:hypothetical protein